MAVHGVHAGQRLRLQRGGGTYGGNGLRDRRIGWQGQEIDPHQAAGAGRIEAHQGQYLGADPGRQQIDDRLPPVLRQLGDRVGRVVGPHPAQDLGDLFVRACAEQPGGPILVEFLEDVRLQLGVLVHLPEDLGLFLLRRVLQQVGDLGRLEPPDTAERATQQRAAGVPDQRLERLPVPETRRVRAGRPGPAQREGPEQPWRPAARIHADHHQLAVAAFQLDVGRTDQARGLHIDEPVTEHVAFQQHLTGTPLEMPKVEPVAGQPQGLAVGAPDLLDRHVDLTAADRGDQTGDQRVVVTAETGDDVGQPPDRFPAAVHERPFEQFGKAQNVTLRRWLRCCGWSCRHECVHSSPWPSARKVVCRPAAPSRGSRDGRLPSTARFGAAGADRIRQSHLEMNGR